MVWHNLRIAWKSLKRNALLTALIISGIALGIGASTTFAAVRHAFARHPIPQKADTLHYVRLDSWDPLKPYPGDDPTRPPTQITYRDMVGVMASKIPQRQTGMAKSSQYVYPDPKVGRPFRENVRLVFADFFPMFDVPFRYGTGWDRQADAGPEPVVVLASEMNDKLFGGSNSVGKTVRIANRDFRVVGVMGPWKPNVKYYDLTQNAIAEPEKIYMPFNHLKPMQLQPSGNRDGWGPSPSVSGFEGLLVSETCWIQMWVELPDGKAVNDYRDFLTAYVMEQKRTGRFPRPLNNRLSTVKEWMEEQKVVPPQANTMLIVSLLFLAVCAVNLVGLLLGKFLARAPEVSVRRALGATRGDIFLQHVIECEVIGIMGGAVGLLLALGGLAALNVWVKTTATRTDFFQLDGPMILLGIGLSLAAGLAAGLYPAWRTCRIPPAVHLKVQ
jgi:putative ABC transport system permease protein